jgi:hypothetical protein
MGFLFASSGTVAPPPTGDSPFRVTLPAGMTYNAADDDLDGLPGGTGPNGMRLARPAITGTTYTPSTTADLQTRFDAALTGGLVGGDCVEIPAGLVLTGNWTIRRRPGFTNVETDGWITIRSSAWASFGALSTEKVRGVRAHPVTHAGLFAYLQGTNAESVLRSEAGYGTTSGYWIEGIDVSTTQKVYPIYGIVRIGDGNPSPQNTLASMPTHHVMAHCCIHGTFGLNGVGTQVNRGLEWHGRYCLALDTWIDGIGGANPNNDGGGLEAQAIGGWNGLGPYAAINCTLKAAGENFMHGGGPPQIPELADGTLRAGDMYFKWCHFYCPPEWKGVWPVKNNFELKFGSRVVVHACVIEGMWISAQTGNSVVIKIGPESGAYSHAKTEQVLFWLVRFHNIGGLYQLIGADQMAQAFNRTDTVQFRDILVTGLNQGIYNGSGNVIQISEGIRRPIIEYHTIITPNHTEGRFIVLPEVYGGIYPSAAEFRYSFGPHGQYGIFRDGGAMGKAALDLGIVDAQGNPDYQWEHMAIQRDTVPGTVWPATTTWVADPTTVFDDEWRVRPSATQYYQTAPGGRSFFADAERIAAVTAGVGN